MNVVQNAIIAIFHQTPKAPTRNLNDLLGLELLSTQVP
jgi:hypothetical protein